VSLDLKPAEPEAGQLGLSIAKVCSKFTKLKTSFTPVFFSALIQGRFEAAFA
jgi:hypothetical protein